jgi:undecaprenyl-diphosphatase
VKSGGQIIASFGVVMPLVGFLVAAIFAFLAVRWMVGWLKKRSLSVFGWYRIGIGVVVGTLAILGVA